MNNSWRRLQKSAVLKSISAEDFMLVQGLPGTGKSATIAFITRLLVSRGKRVLLTSYTHSAVDNLLCKLLECGMVDSFKSDENASNPIIRIGRESSCHVNVQSLLAQTIACKTERYKSGLSSSSIDIPNVEYVHQVISEAKVVGVTALTAPRSPLLSGQHFDVVIVDEAGQISQPAILGAIMAADNFILVGDHMQLPPLVVSEVAEQAGK
jgi:DNA replication ATP-dependent helicase Dna2